MALTAGGNQIRNTFEVTADDLERCWVQSRKKEASSVEWSSIVLWSLCFAAALIWAGILAPTLKTCRAWELFIISLAFCFLFCKMG